MIGSKLRNQSEKSRDSECRNAQITRDSECRNSLVTLHVHITPNYDHDRSIEGVEASFAICSKVNNAKMA